MGASEKTVRWRLKSWSEQGLWDAIFEQLLTQLRIAGRLDLAEVLIDGGAEGSLRRRKVGPNPTDRGGCGSKLNVMTDSRGAPVGVIVSAANEHDVRFILPLVLLKLPRMDRLPVRPRQLPDRVRADQGYTSQDVLKLLTACGIEAEIPQRGDETLRGLGKRRWPLERAISWLKQYRRVGTRRDRKLANYQSYVSLACAIIALKQLMF